MDKPRALRFWQLAGLGEYLDGDGVYKMSITSPCNIEKMKTKSGDEVET